MLSEKSPHHPVIALFDFDGTLTNRDSVLPYLACVGGWPKALTAVGLLPFPRPSRDRNVLKSRLVSRALRGVTATRFREQTRLFVERLPKRYNTEVITRLRWHQTQGHATYFVSASLDAYLLPVGDSLGLTHVFCTQLEIVDDTPTGRFLNSNMRNQEKVRIVNELRRAAPAECAIWAYGNSADDIPMLEAVDRGFLVSKRGTISEFARRSAS